MRLLTAVAILALAAFAAGAADDAKDAAKKLEGTYEVTEFLVGGKPDGKKDEVKSFEIKDGELTIKLEKTKNETAKFTLDPSKKPAHIDVMPGGEKVPGIYEVKETDKGTELTIAFSKGGKSDRPKDFKGLGEDEVVIKLFRKKAK